MELLDGERLDRVNDDLSLIQKKNGLMFGTDALLLAAYLGRGFGRTMELGGGTGIISMLAISRNKVQSVDAVEVQAEFAELIRRNAALNRLSDRLFAINADVRDLKLAGEYDCVFTNPPYMRSDSGRANEMNEKNLARHEVKGGIYDFCAVGAKALRFGGSFYAVYRPDRLTDLFDAMRSNLIEPKRATFVHADTTAEPSMLLVEGRRGGRPGIKVTRPLIIYRDGRHAEYTDDMNFIMESGSFGEDFFIKNG